MKYNRMMIENLFLGDTLPSLSAIDSNRVAMLGGNLYNTYYDSTCMCYRWRESGTVVKRLGDTAMIVGKDTVHLNSNLYFDLDPAYLIQSGRDANILVRKFAIDSLLWGTYATRQTKSAYIDSLRALVGRFDNALIPPSDSNTVKNGIATFGGKLWVGDGTKYRNVSVHKSGDTLFFPNGDTLYAANMRKAGFIDTLAQKFKGLKNFTDGLYLGPSLDSLPEFGFQPLPKTDTLPQLLLFTGRSAISGANEFTSISLRNRSGISAFSFKGGYHYGSYTGSGGYGTIGGSETPFGLDLVNIAISKIGTRIKKISGAPTDSATLVIEGNKAIRIPVGSTADRPAILDSGYFRYNTDSARFEGRMGTTWRGIAWTNEGGGGTITTGVGLLGDGSGGNPARIDTVNLSGAYIKNQIATKEAKNSWYEKSRLDSLLSGFVTVQHNNANGGVVVVRDKGFGVPPVLGDNIGQFAAGGYVNDTVNLGRRGGMRILANQNWSNTANGTTVLFDVTTNDSLTARVRARLWGQGFGVSAYGTSLGSTSLTPPATLFVEKSGGNTNSTKGFALHDSTGAERAHITDAGRFQGDEYIGTSTAQALTDPSGNIVRGYINTDDVVKVLRALGSDIKAQTVGVNITNATGSLTMPDGRAYFTAVWLSEAQTITGVGWLQQTAGAYTADNTNQIGLYTYSGGTLTLVASSSNDGDLWKGTSNSVQKKAFSSTYNAEPGLYIIGMVYNSSSESTAPIIRRITNASPHNSFYNFDTAAKISGLLDSQTALPASQSLVTTTTNSNMVYAFLY